MRPYYLFCIEDIFNSKQKRNKSYSLRSFARDLEMSSGALSQIMSAKRIPSYKKSLELIEKLNISETKKKKFLISVAKLRDQRSFKRGSPELRKFLNSKNLSMTSKELDKETFNAISKWYHYAILEMTGINCFKQDYKWIAKELNITPNEAKSAVERLFHLGFLEDIAGRWSKTKDFFSIKNKNKTSRAHKERQNDILCKSIESLNKLPIEFRNHSAMTMVVAPNKIEAAKEKVSKFLREMSEFLDSDNEQKYVYEMTVNLFPLQRIKYE